MERKRFVIQIDKDKCTSCGKCTKICSKVKHPKRCTGCGKCVLACAVDAITLIERTDNNTNNIIHKEMRKKILKFIVGFIVAAVAFSAVTMLLWNALMPGIFGIASINFWQALGLLVLGRILFSGIGGGNFMHPHGMMDDGRKNFFREKWMRMTPDERRDFFRNHHRGMKHFAMEEFDEQRRDRENEQS